LAAIKLKLETTNNHYSDIFYITVKAFGGKIDKKSSAKEARKNPKASFDQISSFIGAM